MGLITLTEKLRKPDREYTAFPFWFFNGDFTDEEIIRQIRDFRDKGIYGFVLHPRMGIPESIPYLSDAFMHYVKTAVETAHEEGMQVVLYDEGMYPSGSAHGMIAAADPALASVGLTLEDDWDENDHVGEERVVARLANGKFLVCRHNQGTIRGIHFGEDDGEPGAPLSADILNPKAVDLFLKFTHERYYEVLKEYFGSTIIGFFTDEPSILGRNGLGTAEKPFFPWTPGLEEEICSRGGKTEELEALFEGKENKTTAVYHQVITDREGRVYYGKLSSWCQAHGIALMGHPHQSDDIDVQQYFHIPGQDLALRWVAPEKGGLEGMDSVMGKCSSDAARLMGRRRNSNECFGACNRTADGVTIPWYFTGSDMKWYLDWLAVRGVNLFIPHAFYYSIEGARKEERPPDVGANSIWWNHYEQISGYMSRLSYMGTDGKNCADVAVLCDNRNLHWKEVKEFYEKQVEFNYLPLRCLEGCREEHGKLVCAGQAYSCVLGDEVHSLLPGGMPSVKRIRSAEEAGHRELWLKNACPSLRLTHFIKEGKECFFIVNEGETAVSEEAEIEAGNKADSCLAAYDLWKNECYGISVRQQEGRMAFHLELARRESLLLILSTREEYEQAGLRYRPGKEEIKIQNWKLVGENTDALQKEYEGSFYWEKEAIGKETIGKKDTDRVLRVSAEEMVEYYINGSFAGVTFWNPHEVKLTPWLKEGENHIRIVVTGNLANRYGNAEVYYGLL